jgi:hypothetical protein
MGREEKKQTRKPDTYKDIKGKSPTDRNTFLLFFRKD